MTTNKYYIFVIKAKNSNCEECQKFIFDNYPNIRWNIGDRRIKSYRELTKHSNKYGEYIYFHISIHNELLWNIYSIINNVVSFQNLLRENKIKKILNKCHIK